MQIFVISVFSYVFEKKKQNIKQKEKIAGKIERKKERYKIFEIVEL